MEAPRNEAEREEPSANFTDLPNHVVTEILCRLPIKTVVAFKGFCKPLLNLISTDTHLTESHRRRSATTELLLRPAAVRDQTTSTKLYFGNVRFLRKRVIEVKPSLLLDLPVFDLTNDNAIIWGKTERNRFEFENSCNGLLCFRRIVHSISMSCVIINPVTGEFITVPVSTKHRNSKFTVDYGLGFSVKENRFKLLQVSHRYGRYAEICTFEKGSSSWRDVRNCPHPFSGQGSVFLEGRLHFHIMRSYRSGYSIAYFDFEKERFGEVPIPSQYHNDSDLKHEYSLGVLNGCLFISRYATCGYETWLMKEYGVGNSWEKVFCVPYGLLTRRDPLVPVMQLGNGEILMLYGEQCLVSYDPGASSIRIISHGAGKLMGMSAYNPTLLRLKDVLAGYEACIHDVNSRRRNLTQGYQEGEDYTQEVEQEAQ